MSERTLEAIWGVIFLSLALLLLLFLTLSGRGGLSSEVDEWREGAEGSKGIMALPDSIVTKGNGFSGGGEDEGVDSGF